MLKIRILIPFILIALLVVSCHKPEPREPVIMRSGQFLKKSANRNKAIQKEQEKEILEIIGQAEDSLTYHTSSNGFWYRYDTKLDNDKNTPQFGDIVKFTYDIATIEGKEIYSQEEIGTREYKMDQEDIFSGMRNGLKLMKVGETMTFYFPSSIAFDYYGDGEKIGRNIPIRSTVTLKHIKPRNKKSSK